MTGVDSRPSYGALRSMTPARPRIAVARSGIHAFRPAAPGEPEGGEDAADRRGDVHRPPILSSAGGTSGAAATPMGMTRWGLRSDDGAAQGRCAVSARGDEDPRSKP